MKRIEVKLAVPIVAPLLDVMKSAGDGLRESLAAPLAPDGHDPEFRDEWRAELLAAQNDDVETLLGLFDDQFFAEGVIALDGDNAEQILRACAAVRLRLRGAELRRLEDERLESGSVDLDALDEEARKAFGCYLFLATIQELIIEHLDGTLFGGESGD